MRFHLAPRPLVQLITTILLAPRQIFASPHPPASANAGFTFNDLLRRYDCSGELCGWNNQLCCQAGSYCYTDANNEAACGYGSASGYAPVSSVAVASSYGGGGHWQVYTTTIVRTDLVTITTVISNWVGSATVSAVASGSVRCNYALNESPCGSICCAGNQYCAYDGQCAAAYKGQTTTTAASTIIGGGALPPVRGTSATNVIVTQTQSPTTTVPFQTPVATGANVTMTAQGQSSGGGGLSGGAIAGIVIGVLVGLALLALLCFYCCVKGLLDGVLALFGLGGRKKRRVTEVNEYERRTHHSHGGGGGRTWYGAAKPSRVERREKESHSGRNLLGMGAGLAGLWAILGMKRRHNKKHQGQSEYSYSSDYYTSSSSQSSDDRRTRHSQRHTGGRSMSRR